MNKMWREKEEVKGKVKCAQKSSVYAWIGDVLIFTNRQYDHPMSGSTITCNYHHGFAYISCSTVLSKCPCESNVSSNCILSTMHLLRCNRKDPKMILLGIKVSTYERFRITITFTTIQLTVKWPSTDAIVPRFHCPKNCCKGHRSYM